MEFKKKQLPQSEIEIEIILPFLEFEPHVKRAATLLSEENDIEGFRKGKAPYEVVKNKFGEGAIYEHAADLAVRKTYPEVLRELMEKKEIPDENPPIGRPEVTVTKLAPGNELRYRVKLAFLPTFTPPDYKRIARDVRKNRQEVTVTDEEVTKTLEWIQNSRAQLITVDRPAERGDTVEVDFEIRHDGVKIENGESRNHPIVLGQGRFVPGFEDQLVGMRAGEEKSFTLVAPPDWHQKSFAGKSLDITTTLKSVQERKLPKLDDAFAQGLGKFSSLDALHQNIREGLSQEKEDKETQRIRAMIVEEIARTAQIEVPEVLVRGELDKMLEEFRSNIEGMGMRWEDYLVHIKKNVEELRRDLQGEAENRVRIALILRQIARKENIEPTEEEVDARANQYLAQYKTAQEAEAAIDPTSLQEYARGILKNEKVFEFLEQV